jgi:hypothetical protein
MSKVCQECYGRGCATGGYPAALQQRPPKYVQELLGHASIAFTLDTYSRVLPGMGGGGVGAMEEPLPNSALR